MSNDLLIGGYRKVTGYKVNIQKVNHFLYSSNKQVEFEIKNTIPFTLALGMGFNGMVGPRVMCAAVRALGLLVFSCSALTTVNQAFLPGDLDTSFSERQLVGRTLLREMEEDTNK